MFTGIIESMGQVTQLSKAGGNLLIVVEASFVSELKIDQSVSHNGVCLTVVAKDAVSYTVTAIAETLEKSNLGALAVDSMVNLERAMQLGDRLDGHIVQGHVDQTAVCTNIEEHEGSWFFSFRYDEPAGGLIVPKGSITVNGVSLTVVEVDSNSFSVAIIPYTFEHTNFKFLQIGDRVNLEFDVIGKYVAKLLHAR